MRSAVGTLLCTHVARLGLHQRTLAAKSGVSASTIAMVVAGQRKLPLRAIGRLVRGLELNRRDAREFVLAALTEHEAVDIAELL